MSQRTKKQQYKYSLRVTNLAPSTFPNGYLCNRQFYIFPVPPQDALTIENLYLHLKVRFNVGIAAGSRKIMKVGIADERPIFANDYAPRFRYYDVNINADADRYAEVDIDLSALLDKEAVGYKNYFDNEDPATKYTYVYFDLPEELLNTGGIGDLYVCKITALYTTLGIQ